MKLTKVTEWPQSGEGTMHEVPRLRTKVGGPDKGVDNARGLLDIYSLGIRVGLTAGAITVGKLPSSRLRDIEASSMQPQGSSTSLYQVLPDRSQTKEIIPPSLVP